MTKHTASLLLLSAALALSGCKADSALKKGEVIDQSTGAHSTAAARSNTASVADIAQEGSIDGVVHFKGTPPKRIAIDMSMDPACALVKEPNLTEQYVVNDGKLANVYLYIKSGVAASSAPSDAAPVVLDQKGCRYVPHVLAVQQGGVVEFKNSDPTMHNIHIVPANSANPPIDISQGPDGAPQTHRFHSPETMMPVRCNNHPWMSAFLNVADSPFFAVTGKDGRFTINGLPPGNYTLAAVQEKMGEKDIQVTVKPHSTTTASFTFSQ